MNSVSKKRSRSCNGDRCEPRFALKKAGRGIEAERLLTKLVVISKRVHGPDHVITKRAASLLQQCKVRYVNVVIKSPLIGVQAFQALRYEQGGGKCVVQGPIAQPRNIRVEKIFTVPSAHIIFGSGTPVICHGLKTLSHRKIGNLQPRDEGSGLYYVRFEDKDIDPRPLKQVFMQLLFDLPEES